MNFKGNFILIYLFLRLKFTDLIYIIISILASVSVSVLLKIARNQNIDIAQAVAFNYPIAVLLSFIFLKPNFTDFQIDKSWWIFASLGILLPTVFIVMGKSVQNAGIVKSDAAQRLSLILTLMVAYFFWNESFSTQKIMGVGLALVALFFLLIKKEKSNKKNSQIWLWLLGVWAGYGIIDLMFKIISKISGNAFSTTLTLSFLLAAILIFLYLFFNKTKFNRSSILGGILLGILNFTNIYTYIKAHQFLGESPSLVFTGINIGVIALGTVVGIFIFKEKLNRFNYVGIGLALLAIVLLFVEITNYS